MSKIRNLIKSMSTRGKLELSFVVVVTVIITALAFHCVDAKTALKVEKRHSDGLKYEKAGVVAQFETYKAKSITFEELERKNQRRIQAYVKKNFRTIPTSTAKLIAESTVQLAEKHDLPVSLIVGMMKVESNFNPSAVSKRYARGLMQVRWSIWKKVLGEKLDMKDEYSLHDIDRGMEAGVIVFKHYLEKNKNNVSRALYDYVGKNRPYVTKVYETMGRFILYGQAEFKE